MGRLTGRFTTTPGDRRWRADARCAVCPALVFAGMATLLDWASGGLTVERADLWSLLAVVVFTVLRPPRVTVGDGWLTVRGFLRVHRVRTDALAVVWQDGRIATRLLLGDTYGRSAAFDPRVLTADPLLWHELDTGARQSLAHGTLRQGADVLRQLRERIDGGTARAILGASGLE